MAGTGGFFLKGLAGSIRGMPQRIYEVRWRKKQEDALQKKQDELIEATSLYSKTAEQLGADGFYSDDDLMKLNTIVITGGTEFQEIIKGTHAHISGMNAAQVEKDMDLVDAFIEMSKGMNLKELDESLEMLRGFVKSETALNKLAAYDSLYKKKHEIQPPAEVFPTAAGVQEAYPEAGYKYTKEGYVPEFIKPTAPKAPDIMDRELAGIDRLEKAGVLSKEQANLSRIKIHGGVLPEKPTKGVAPKVSAPPVPTTTENVREDIREADTLKDAQRIHKNYVAKYGEGTLGIADVDKYWAEGQTEYLSNVKQALDNIINEKGWLKTGTLTQEEVGLEFKGDQKVEEIYEKLREEYMKYRDTLEKMGVDVSQFPKIKPLSEIEKVGWLEGAKTLGGVGRGQYKSIYY